VRADRLAFKLVLTGLLLLAVSVNCAFGGKPRGVQRRLTDDVATVVCWLNCRHKVVRLYDLITLKGGPFPYEKDGVVFGNRERLLPQASSAVTTASTPSNARCAVTGATRRIVCGGKPKTPDACYYTADHYASFRKIVP
jgi:ribonuclease T1